MLLQCQILLLHVCIACIVLATIPVVTASSVKSQPTHIRIGTRPSPLAKAQAQAVADLLQQASSTDDKNDESSAHVSAIQCTIQEIQTKGDHTSRTAGTQDVPLAVRAVDFTGALDDALLEHQIDAAVHSLKDIRPTSRWRQGLYIACHLPREIPQDVLVGPYSLIDSLPPHAKVGTSAIRRQAQLLALRPDLDFINVRGNVETRLDALTDGTVDALILAQAGLDRLRSGGHEMDFSWHPIPSHDILSAACQGIVAVVCRADDSVTRHWMAKINDRDSSIAAAAERSFLDVLDTFSPSHYGKDSTIPWKGRPPLAAFMEKMPSDTDEIGKEQWMFQGLLARPDGSKVLRECQTTDTLSVEEAAKLGRQVAENILQKAGKDFYA